MRPFASSLAALLTVVVFSLPGLGARAQGRVYEPSAGSAERKAIMDALRKPVETSLNRPVLFRVPHPNDFRAQKGWAFLTVELRKPDGSPMDFRGTRYADRGRPSDVVVALLHRTGRRWRVAAFVLPRTDLEWGEWSRKYHAPRAIFPRRP